MSDQNKDSIHNSGQTSSSNDGFDSSKIDYNVSAASLTRSLFDENRRGMVRTDANKENANSENKKPENNNVQKSASAKRFQRPKTASQGDKSNKKAPVHNGSAKISEEKSREHKRQQTGSPAQQSHQRTVQKANHAHRSEQQQGQQGHSKQSKQIKQTNHTNQTKKVKPENRIKSVKQVKNLMPAKLKQSIQTKSAGRSNKVKAERPKKNRRRLSDMSVPERLLWGFKWIVRVAIVLVFSVIFACVGAGLGIYIGVIRHAPSLEVISIEPENYTSFVYDKDGNQIDEFHGEENRVYVTLDQIPENMQNAFIAVEDERFYTHNGIDLRGIARAAYSIFSGRDIQGASTITQQLIKNNVTKVSHNDFESKIQEQYLAVQYESMLTEQLGSKEAAKKYILELYLNTINLSHGYNGVQVAARGYYNKDVSELDLAECAVIAGITNNPSHYSPRSNPENNKERQEEILRKMKEQGYITQEDYDSALAEDVYSSISSTTNTAEDKGTVVHTYFVDSLFDQVSQDLQDKYKISPAQANYIIYNSGIQIYSTFDKNIQSILDSTFADSSLFPNANYNLRAVYTVSVEDSATGKQEHSEYSKYVTSQEAANDFVANKKAEIQNSLGATESIVAERSDFTIEPQAAMVIEDYHTGYVPALIGGRGAKTVNRGFNRATQSPRQPGSVFKILAAYAPGIDMGVLTAATPIEDSPFTVGNYSPGNWWGDYYKGMENVRKAIQQSMNVVTVKAMDMVGVDNCYDYLLNFGFTTLEEDNHLSTALGGITNGVTQLEVTAAYGTIGNGGVYKKPTLYTKVLDHDGNELLNYEEDFEDREVLSPGASYVLIDMMKDVLKYPGTGTAAAFRNSNMAVCGKTGTTQNSRDLTFVGLTPYYAAGIWLGYDEYDDTIKNMEGLNQTAHEVVWRTCMEKVHEGLEVKDFEMPDDVVQVNVCTYSGLKPNSGCGSHSEYFVKGTEPTEYCKGHYAKLYLDPKYINNGYGYSDLDTGYQSSSSSETDDAESEPEPEEPIGQHVPTDEEIQQAYENEFGGLDDGGSDSSGGGADTSGGDSSGGGEAGAPVEAAPADSAPAQGAAE